MLSGPIWGPIVYMVSMINMSKRYKYQVPKLQQLSSDPAKQVLDSAPSVCTLEWLFSQRSPVMC